MKLIDVQHCWNYFFSAVFVTDTSELFMTGGPLIMIKERMRLTTVGEYAVCLGVLVCMVACGVLAAGCSSLQDNTALPSFEEDIAITIGEGNVGRNFASYPVTIENRGILVVDDVRLQADLLDVTGGGETVIASQVVNAGSLEPNEIRTIEVQFRLIKLTDKDVDLRVARVV